MCLNKITIYVVDSLALASAVIIALPFALMIAVPLFGAF